MRMNGYMRATANVRCFFNAEAAELSLMQERRCRGIKSPRYGGAGPGSGRQAVLACAIDFYFASSMAFVQWIGGFV
jgi:hypothetical protein